MDAYIFSSVSVKPLLLSALPAVTGNGARRDRHRGLFRPCPATQDFYALSDGFNFQEGLESVKARLHQNHKNKREVLTTIDHLKRLCMDHYFQDEIDNAVDSCLALVHSDDLLEATLSLRLAREAKYDISADEVLRKFTDDNGDFKIDHCKDIRGLVSLQDISHLNMGESSLYKAKEFSRRHLTSAIRHLNPNLARYVRHSLDHPYHVSLMQYKARYHLSYLQSLPTRNTAMEELAVAELYLNKLQHQKEMQEVKRWWMDLGLTREIRTARDQVLKWYMWAMTVVQGFSLSRWDLAAAGSLPGYMLSCYKALYTVTNEIVDMAKKEHGLNPMDQLRNAWETLFDAFLVERKWLSSNQVPSPEDYLRNGIITSGVPLIFLHLFFMLGHDSIELDGNNIPRVIYSSAKIVRLRDDMGSAKDEVQEGFDGSYKEMYLRENPHADVEEHMLEMITKEWEELNRECFSRTRSSCLSPSFLLASLNLARMTNIIYGYDNEQRLPVLEDYIGMLLL
ncbi:hypothetical protein VPH35_113355 [Triticum aestivum]|uniref:S-(+)-linalool synthase, chloroplastic isoform X2 n=1 Tax=Triticum aestivum TaxID=4565 RepID=UPI001D004158|nr:S-(+)-linalool synthase, chloroplastic-like isoform X2 [Triticum aestivum]